MHLCQTTCLITRFGTLSKNDQLAAALSNSNFHPKNLVLETCVFNDIGSGRWGAYTDGVLSALKWVQHPTEPC